LSFLRYRRNSASFSGAISGNSKQPARPLSGRRADQRGPPSLSDAGGARAARPAGAVATPTRRSRSPR
jgi:hypothetical protein